jgi:hypothetical protein
MTDFAPVIEQPNLHGYLDASTLELIGKPASVGADLSLIPDPSLGPMPTVDELHRLRDQPWFVSVKRSLTGRAFKDFVLGTPPADDRDNTMMSLIGGVVDFVYGKPFDGTPEQAFACMVDAVEQMSPDKGGAPRDWLRWTWGKIGYSWVRRVARDQDKPAPLTVLSEERTIAKGQPLNLKDLVVKVREWCPAPELHDADSDTAQRFIMDMSLVALPKGYVMLRRDGYYDPMNYAQKFIWPQLRDKGFGDIFPLVEETKDGTRELSDNHLIRHLPFVHVKRVKARSGLPGAILEGIGSHSPALVLPIYSRRTDLTPEPSDEVTELFRVMVGDDQLRGFEHYLARALEIERPICMAALIGAPGTGKSFIVKALADCFWPPAPCVPGSVLVGQFQDELMTNPIVHLEEAFPVKAGAQPVRDVLRQWIGGSSFLVNQKYDLKIDVDLQPRLLHTANNDNSLSRLSTDEGNRDDQEAIIQRTIKFDIRPEAIQWFRDHGGLDLTQSWIGGNRCEANYKLTKHLLWLYEQREELGRAGARFLIEGNTYKGAQELKDKINDSEMLVEVAGLICRLLEGVRTGRYSPQNGVVIDDTGVWLTTAALLAFKDRDRTPLYLTMRIAGLQLSNLSDIKISGSTERKCTSGEMQRARWYRMDIAELNRIAEDTGQPNALLSARLAMMEQPSAVPQR